MEIIPPFFVRDVSLFEDSSSNVGRDHGPLHTLEMQSEEASCWIPVYMAHSATHFGNRDKIGSQPEGIQGISSTLGPLKGVEIERDLSGRSRRDDQSRRAVVPLLNLFANCELRQSRPRICV
jgi:hypothetical protein